MRDSIYRVSLDVHDTASQVQLISLKGDTARHIEFTLTEDGKPYKLSEGDTATVAAKKPDGTTALNACEIYLETGIIKFDFTSAFVAANGLIECNLRVIGSDGHLLTSPRFTILVNEMAFDGTGVTGTDEWTLLSQKVTAATNATTAANNAATSATTAASTANTAAGSANSAASSATTAAGTANSAASSATAAATSANTAASTANGAATSADYSSDLATAAATSATNAATSANTAAALAQSRAQDAYRAYDSATAAATRANTASTGAEKVNISATRNAAQKKVTVTTTDRTGTETNVDVLDGAKGDKGDAGAYVNASTSANSFEALEEQTEWYVDNVEQERYVMITSLINAVSLQQATRLVIGVGDDVYYFQLASSYTERATNYLDYVSSEAQKKIHLGDDDTLEVIDDVFHLETSTAITAGSTDNTVSTSKAVYDFVSPIATRVSDNETAIAGKADTAHTHSQGQITGLSSALSGKANSSHTHSQSDISGLSTALNDKASKNHNHLGVYASYNHSHTGYAYTSHTHTTSDINGFSGHTHTQSQVNGLSTSLSLKADTATTYTKAQVDTALSSKADTSSIPTTIAQLTDDATHRVVTDVEKASWNGKSDFSGDYNDLENKPTIPVVPTNVSAFTNDSGYLVASDISGKADKSAQITNGTEITLADNTEYRLTDVTTLAVTYPTGNFECWMRISVATEGTVNISFPSSSHIGDAPTFANGETWELSIKDACMIASKVTV